MKIPPVPPNCELFMVDHDALLNEHVRFAVMEPASDPKQIALVVFKPIEELLELNDKYYRAMVSSVAMFCWQKEQYRLSSLVASIEVQTIDEDYTSFQFPPIKETCEKIKTACLALKEWHKWSTA